MTSITSLILVGLGALANCQSTFSPLRPPSIPLAVRSPYLTTWQQAGADGGHNGGYLAGQWPSFWAGAITGWCGLLRVDNVSYVWMGAPPGVGQVMNQTAFEYTSTRSTFTMNVNGEVELKAKFLSPVTPDDLMRSSLPYSYLEVEVRSTDGKTHDVQLYTDISAEWVSGDRGSIAEWAYGVVEDNVSPGSYVPVAELQLPAPDSPKRLGTKTAFDVPTTIIHPPWNTLEALVGSVVQSILPSGLPSVLPSILPSVLPSKRGVADTEKRGTEGVAYHKVFRQEQLPFAEINQQTEYGNWYYATENVASLTHRSGADTAVRKQFADNGHLDNSADGNYRPIQQNFPVFGFSRDLGSVGSSSASALFQISLHQENAIQFLGNNGVQPVPSLWTSYFDGDTKALKFFYDDYEQGSSIASTFDDKVKSDSLAYGQDYLSLTSLAVRQAFGAIEFTNTPAEPLLFMKEISSDGNVNTADVIFPFHPIAIYTNASILKWLLDPLFINQEAGNWPNKYAIHDIGAAFPNATGHPDGKAEDMPLEECGNMLLMTLAYAQRADDNAYLTQHYQILDAWTQYLIQEALIPADQISTDDFAGSLANQTNLALKGILGIEAMASIANRTGHSATGANYSSIAHDYIHKWQTLGFALNASPPHATLSYGQNATWGLLYNLFMDRELGLGLVPQSVYDIQDAWYPTVFEKYGVPLDTRHSYTKNDWELYVAATSNPSLRDRFVSTIATWLGSTPTNFAFTDLYDTVTGDYPGITFSDRPVVGGLFSMLALASAPAAPASAVAAAAAAVGNVTV